VRVKGATAGNTVDANVIGAAAIFGAHLSGSVDTTFRGNLIGGGKVGIMLDGATASQIRGNVVVGINGRGVVVEGPATHSAIAGNLISGRGSSAIDTADAAGLSGDSVARNTTSWDAPTTQLETAGALVVRHPMLTLWLTILLVPLTLWILVRVRRLPSRRLSLRGGRRASEIG
jgi:nitrous oxidase accessory protein NosD